MSDTTAFAAATAQRDTINAALREAIAALNAVTDELAGDAPRAMNLTPDHVKADPRWRAAKAAADRLFETLRQFALELADVDAVELALERHAKRNPTIVDF